MCKIHLLSVNVISKIKTVINEVIVGRNRMGWYFTKDLLFDIFSLANQLYQSKSIILEGPKPSKIYFSKNLVSDLLLDRLKALLA